MPLTQDEREALVERWTSRFQGDALRFIHDQLMIDYDNITDAGLQALANGVRWVTFEPTESEDEGNLDFSDGPVTNGGTCTENDLVTLEWVEVFVDVLGLTRVEDEGTGVHCWGDFSAQ